MNGATIRKSLERMGIKQTELARLLGITPQAVSGILSASDVRTGTVERICNALNLSMTFFYEDDSWKDREIQYLRGQVAAYEAALSRLRFLDQ